MGLWENDKMLRGTTVDQRIEFMKMQHRESLKECEQLQRTYDIKTIMAAKMARRRMGNGKSLRLR